MYFLSLKIAQYYPKYCISGNTKPNSTIFSLIIKTKKKTSLFIVTSGNFDVLDVQSFNK